MPARQEREQLEGIIQRLSGEHDGVTFTPHLTLFCGKTDDIAKTKLELKNILNKESRIKLLTNGIKASTQFYKTLFLTFHDHEKLNQLANKLKLTLDINSDYEFVSHLSLLYSFIPHAEKEKLIGPTTKALHLKKSS